MRGESSLTLPVFIDYSQSLRDMIAAARFDEVNDSINPRNFRVEKTGFQQVGVTLIQFSRPVGSFEVLRRMTERGYRPTLIEELLALSAQYPDLQRSIPIAALGSARVVKNCRYVPCVGGSQSMRTLTLEVMYSRWSSYYRFAFVKE